MQINLSELFSCQGKVKTYIQNLEMECFHSLSGDYPVAEKEPVELTITQTGERKMTVSGKARFALMMPCDRCLEPVLVSFALPIEEDLDMSQSDEERVKALDEQPYISGYYLDVDRLVFNEWMLNLPMKVLCREDCKGICNRCGINLNHGSCTCDSTVPDIRMSVIQDIFNQYSKEFNTTTADGLKQKEV